MRVTRLWQKRILRAVDAVRERLKRVVLSLPELSLRVEWLREYLQAKDVGTTAQEHGLLSLERLLRRAPLRQSDRPLDVTPPVPDYGTGRELTVGERKSGSTLRFGLGLEQVGQSFGFGQIDPAILERPAGEFAGLGPTQTFERSKRTQHGVDNRSAAVAMQLDQVFAGCTARRVEAQHQRIVEDATAVRIAKTAQRTRPRGGQVTAKRTSRAMRVRPADTDDRDCRWRAPARNCEDRIVCHAGKSLPGQAATTAGQPSTGATS